MKLMKYNEFITEKIIHEDIYLPSDVLDIANAYNKYGKELYVVGGAVRDFLQGKIPHDYDLTTNALPEESKNILKNFNVSDEQGKNFGVIRVFTENEPTGYEIASFRRDISKGRDVKGDDKKVEIGKDITIEDDCKRRDLTINAIFYDINKKEIVDLVGGVDDIKNGIIRSVGDPSKRFDEDRLRILRIFRFTARTDGKIDTVTSQSIKNDNRLKGIGPKDDVSQERILDEWNKVMEHSKHNVEVINKYIYLLTEYDMWEQMFPNMNISKPRNNFKRNELNNAIIFQNIFQNIKISKNKRYMVNILKLNTELVNEIEFLSLFDDIEVNDIYKLAKKKYSYYIDDELIRNFLPGKFTESFIKYCNDGFVIDGNILKEQGFKGKEIEDEKQRLEIERFKLNYI